MPLPTALLLSAGGLATLGLLPFALRRHVHVERSAVLDASPAAVLALAASNAGYQRFNPYCDVDPGLTITLFGPESGVGSGFRFEGKEGRGTQVVAAVDTDAITYAIDLGAMGKPTQRLAVEAFDGGTRVTWSMDADLGRNPIARVFGLFMDRMIGATFERSLRNLDNATATSTSTATAV